MKPKETIEEREKSGEVFGQALAGSTSPIIGDCFRSTVEQLAWFAFFSQEKPNSKEPAKKQKK